VTGRLRGRLLVANPNLPDPNFARSVVLMLEHGEEGAVGVVLNRPSQTPVEELIGPLGIVAAPPGLVHIGGPVSPSSAICVGRPHPGYEPGPEEGLVALFDGLVIVDLDVDFSDLKERLAEARLFAGYAGWGPGQLEDEIEAGGWYVVASMPGDCLSPDAENLWRTVLRRQGPPLAILANFPLKPELN
jgi:putative transcriptional regulator